MQICPEGEIAGGREEGVMEKMKEQTKRQKLTFFSCICYRKTYSMSKLQVCFKPATSFLPTRLVTSEQSSSPKKQNMKLQTFWYLIPSPLILKPYFISISYKGLKNSNIRRNVNSVMFSNVFVLHHIAYSLITMWNICPVSDPDTMLFWRQFSWSNLFLDPQAKSNIWIVLSTNKYTLKFYFISIYNINMSPSPNIWI